MRYKLFSCGGKDGPETGFEYNSKQKYSRVSSLKEDHFCLYDLFLRRDVWSKKNGTTNRETDMRVAIMCLCVNKVHVSRRSITTHSYRNL
jgi:hypothetical protein